MDIPAPAFPASVQVYHDAVGGGWRDQVFSVEAPQSMTKAPHDLDLGAVKFSQYGVYVVAFVNADAQSTAWQYFQVQRSLPSGRTLTINGTFKLISNTVLATNTTGDGVVTTVSMVTVARNDSTSPETVTGRITFKAVSQVDSKTGNGTLFGVGTFTGTIAGMGPGECTYLINSTLTGQGSPQASSRAQHLITACNGGLRGVTETTVSIGKGVFTAVVQVGQQTTAAQTVSGPGASLR